MPRRTSHDCRAGFTLVEVLVSLSLLTGALLVGSQVLVAAARAAALSREATVAAMLASQKLEQLRSLAWGYDLDGTPADGCGLSPPGSLAGNVEGFADYQDENGNTIGDGSSPPPRAVFTRRWSVERAATDPAGVLTFSVVILRLGQAPRAAPGSERPWAEVARLASARSRRTN